MGAVEVLIWLGVILAGLVVLSIVATLVLVVCAAIVGLRRMREDEDVAETPIFRGRAEK